MPAGRSNRDEPIRRGGVVASIVFSLFAVWLWRYSSPGPRPRPQGTEAPHGPLVALQLTDKEKATLSDYLNQGGGMDGEC